MITRNIAGKVDESVRRTILELSAQVDSLSAELARVKAAPSNGAMGLSPFQLQQVAGLIGSLAQPLIGSTTSDPVLAGVPSSSNAVTNVGATSTSSGLTLASNGGTAPTITLSGTPNIGGANITSGTINTARLPATINIATAYQIAGVQVVNSQKTGWSAWTGSATRSTKDTTTATLANVAEALKALLDDLLAHGLIGA